MDVLPNDILRLLTTHIQHQDFNNFTITCKRIRELCTRDWASLIADLVPKKVLPHLRHNANSYLRCLEALEFMSRISNHRYGYTIDAKDIHIPALRSVVPTKLSIFLCRDDLLFLYGGGHGGISMCVRTADDFCTYTENTKKSQDVLFYLAYFHREQIAWT